MKVVLIEGSEELARDVSLFLQLRWPQCDVLHSAGASRGEELVETDTPDLVILDLDSAHADGLDTLASIRSFSDVPLIVLTEDGNEMDNVRALEMGADDCVTKPIKPVEFLAKLRALFRRIEGVAFRSERELLESGSLMLNVATHEVSIYGNPIRLTPIEYHLLVHLLRNQGRVVTHSALLQSIWGREFDDDTSSVKKYIYRLRAKLGDDGQNPKVLVSERGVGYKLLRSS